MPNPPMQPRKRQYPQLIHLADIIEQPLYWLWYPYIPIGMCTMMYGRGGIGKSHIACDIAARITRGDAFPGGTEPRVPGNVLMLSAEDDYSRVLKPRLRRLGADMDRIFVPESENFVLDAPGIRQLEEYMLQMTAAVVFIDPVAFYLGGKVDINRMNEVREFTGALHQAAKAANCAIVLVHHSKKGDSADYEKAVGSVDFINSMRSTLYVDVTPDGTKVMRQPKNNNAPNGRTLAFHFNEDKFEWLNDYTDNGEPGESLGRSGHSAAKAKAVAFLKAELAAGPLPAQEVKQRALDEGINERTLQRAKGGVAESYAARGADGVMVWYLRLVGFKKHAQELEEAKKSALGFSQPKTGDEKNANEPEIHNVEKRNQAQIQKARQWASDRSELDADAPRGLVVRDGQTGTRGRDSGTGGISGTPEEGRADPSSSLSLASDFDAEIARILAAQQKAA